jgi:hypothetical protein
MRAVFIFTVLIVLLGLAVPVTFAVQLWMGRQAGGAAGDLPELCVGKVWRREPAAG